MRANALLTPGFRTLTLRAQSVRRSPASEAAMFLSPAPLLLSTQLLLAADEVPRLDYEITCRAARPLSAQDTRTYQTCMNDETGARSQLERQWLQFPASAKGRCTQEASLGGSPSCVELLTCLQIAKDVDPGGEPTRRP